MGVEGGGGNVLVVCGSQKGRGGGGRSGMTSNVVIGCADYRGRWGGGQN